MVRDAMKEVRRSWRFWPFWNRRTTPPKRARPYRAAQVEGSNEGKDWAVLRFVQRPRFEPTTDWHSSDTSAARLRNHRRRALDALLLRPFAHADRLAQHASRCAFMRRTGEPNRRARLRHFRREQQVVEFSGLRVNDHSARVLDAYLDATGARNVLLVSSKCSVGTGRRTHHQHGEGGEGLCHRESPPLPGMIVIPSNVRQAPAPKA